MQSKLRKYKKYMLILMAVATLVGIPTANAGYVSDSRAINGYSLVGLHVLNVTFHASGYSYSRSGSVSNMYFTDWAWFPNTVSSRSTWKSSIPYGEKANGTVYIGVGLNSPWGVANLWGGQHYFSINF